LPLISYLFPYTTLFRSHQDKDGGFSLSTEAVWPSRRRELILVLPERESQRGQVYSGQVSGPEGGPRGIFDLLSARDDPFARTAHEQSRTQGCAHRRRQLFGLVSVMAGKEQKG